MTWTPEALREARPPTDADQVQSSLTLSIVASADQAPGQQNFAVPGSTLEAFSCTPLPADLTGKRIEALLTLTGEIRATRWWISHIRMMP